MEMASMEMRMFGVETAVETLTRSVDRLADVIVARVLRALDDSSRAPLVLTTRQLQAAVRTAMGGEESTASGKRKRPVEGEAAREKVVDVDVDVLATPPAMPKRKPIQTVKPTAPRQIEEELELPSPTSLSLAMLDAAIDPHRFGLQPTQAMKNSSQPKPTVKQPAPVAVRQSFAAIPPKPAVVIDRPPRILEPTRPSVVTPPPPQPRPPVPVQVQATSTVSGRLFLWGNAWHNLPEEFEFPKQTLELMWRQWCCGDRQYGYLPFREIQAADFASTNNRKRFSDLKFLMRFIEQLLQARGVWKEMPNEVEADQMLHAVQGELFPDAVGKKGQKKRDGEGLKWHSAVTLLRTANKKARTE